jgi:hypothetical protein
MAIYKSHITLRVGDGHVTWPLLDSQLHFLWQAAITKNQPAWL